MKFVFGVFLLTVLPAGLPALAQQQATPEGNILQLSLAALLQSQSTITDASLTGTARRIAGSQDETGTCTLRMLESSGSREDYSYPSGSLIEIRAGERATPAGEWIGSDGTVHALPSHNLFTERAWFFPLAIIRHSLDITHYQAVYVGTETIDGEAVQHFTYWRSNAWSPEATAELERLSRTEIYLDSTNLLPVRIVYSAHPDRDAHTFIPVEVRYSSYQLVNGAQIPFEIQQYRNHTLSLDLKIQSAALDSGLAASLFDLQ